MDIAGDLTAIFDTDIFAVRAIYRPGGTGPGVELVGIFDDSHVVQGLGQIGGEGREVVFRCPSAGISPQQGDTLKVNETVYKVRSARPDGTGVVVLVLGPGS